MLPARHHQHNDSRASPPKFQPRPNDLKAKSRDPADRPHRPRKTLMEQLLVAPPKAPPLAVFRRGVPAPTPRPHYAATEAQPRPESRSVDMSIVQSILDCIQIGAMAVGAGMQVSFANRAAMRECSRHGMLRIEDTQVALLALPGEADQARMMRAVEAAHSGHWSLVRLGSGTSALSIAVFPLLHSERGSGSLALLLFGLSHS